MCYHWFRWDSASTCVFEFCYKMTQIAIETFRLSLRIFLFWYHDLSLSMKMWMCLLAYSECLAISNIRRRSHLRQGAGTEINRTQLFLNGWLTVIDVLCFNKFLSHSQTIHWNFSEMTDNHNVLNTFSDRINSNFFFSHCHKIFNFANLIIIYWVK